LSGGFLVPADFGIPNPARDRWAEERQRIRERERAIMDSVVGKTIASLEMDKDDERLFVTLTDGSCVTICGSELLGIREGRSI
jgi:hypothetical protein